MRKKTKAASTFRPCGGRSSASLNASSNCLLNCPTICRPSSSTSKTPAALPITSPRTFRTFRSFRSSSCWKNVGSQSGFEYLNTEVAKELEVLELRSKIQNQVQEEVGKSQREYFLREQLRAIQRELGESDDNQREIEELRKKVEAAGMTEEARKEADRELGRLSPNVAGRCRIHGNPNISRLACDAAVECAVDRTRSISSRPGRFSIATITISKRSRSAFSNTSPCSN